MSNFSTCNNGHNYDSSLYDKCPYCPANVDDINYKQTLTEFKNTLALTGENELEKTIVEDEMAKSTEHTFKKTQIIVDGKIANITSPQEAEKRKLVGWLVTFHNNQYGQDFKLYNGKNKIGSATGCDIIINDPSVSGEHTTILFRENEFLIKDNFSTNGTKVNGVSVSEGKLKDGDELQLGNTILKFKTVF